eukprot:910763-Amphidinium_carterae.1
MCTGGSFPVTLARTGWGFLKQETVHLEWIQCLAVCCSCAHGAFGRTEADKKWSSLREAYHI